MFQATWSLHDPFCKGHGDSREVKGKPKGKPPPLGCFFAEVPGIGGVEGKPNGHAPITCIEGVPHSDTQIPQKPRFGSGHLLKNPTG